MRSRLSRRGKVGRGSCAPRGRIGSGVPPRFPCQPARSIDKGERTTEKGSLPCGGHNRARGERQGMRKRIDGSEVCGPGLYMTCQNMGCRANGDDDGTVPGVFAHDFSLAGME